MEYHIKLNEEHSAKYAIIPGDPGRVEKIAAYLDDAKQVAYNREYNSYLGYLEGEKVLVVSTGIGGASAGFQPDFPTAASQSACSRIVGQGIHFAVVGRK